MTVISLRCLGGATAYFILAKLFIEAFYSRLSLAVTSPHKLRLLTSHRSGPSALLSVSPFGDQISVLISQTANISVSFLGEKRTKLPCACLGVVSRRRFAAQLSSRHLVVPMYVIKVRPIQEATRRIIMTLQGVPRRSSPLAWP